MSDLSGYISIPQFFALFCNTNTPLCKLFSESAIMTFTQSQNVKWVSKLNCLPHSLSNFILNNGQMPFHKPFWHTKGTLLLVLATFHLKFYYIVHKIH